MHRNVVHVDNNMAVVHSRIPGHPIMCVKIPQLLLLIVEGFPTATITL